MAKNIEPALKKIGDYLKLDEDTVFTIPAYQRAYEWDIERCDKLWQDVIDFVQSNSRDCYFFGTIIMNCVEGERCRYELIDGQQRTTTFLLLLKALLNRINVAITQMPDDSECKPLLNGLEGRRRKIMHILYQVDEDEIGYKPGEADGALYAGFALVENYSINEDDAYKQELGKILRAKDYEEAERNVIKLRYKQRDNRYTNFFRNFKYFSEKIAELSDAQINSIAKTILDNCEIIVIKSWIREQAINMFNSLNSKGMPLYDSDIISAQMFAEASRLSVQADFEAQWKQLNETIVDLESQNICSINAILTQYMYYVRTKNGDTLNAATGAVNVTTPGLRRYFTEINKALLSAPTVTCADLMEFANGWVNTAGYPQMKVLMKFNENFKLFLAGYFYRVKAVNITAESIKPVLDCFLRLFALLELVDIGYSSKPFKMFLFREAVRLIDENVTVADIVADFTAHIQATWTRADIAEKLREYDGNALVYLNEYLFALEKNKPFTLGAKYDIEHIMPQSGRNLHTIMRDAGIADRSEFDAIVNKLGNKILLEENINRSIGNEWFRTKVSTRLSDKTGYVDSIYPIACALVETYRDRPMPYWKKDEINDATEKAIDRILRFIFGD